jgi:hypothetical protein
MVGGSHRRYKNKYLVSISPGAGGVVGGILGCGMAGTKLQGIAKMNQTGFRGALKVQRTGGLKQTKRNLSHKK